MADNRNQRLRRVRPVVALAVMAFAAGAIFGAEHGSSPTLALAEGFVGAWARGEYLAMYQDITPASQRAISAGEFAQAYEQALTTATATHLSVAGRPRAEPQGAVAVPVRVHTRLFGTLSLQFTLSFGGVAGEGERIEWSRSLEFPGLRHGELLIRDTTLPERAALLARDGSVLAEAAPAAVPGGQAGEVTRNSPLGSLADAVLGTVGPVPAARRQMLAREGVPGDAIVGLSGLELALDARLRGNPGGALLAGARVLAYARPQPAPPLRTTVSPAVQRAAVTALGGQLGGVVAMRPNGEILAVAGIGLDALQPPGSTFKMVTTTGVLSARIASVGTVFPYATFATLDGVRLNNANGEECGGSLELAFAVSCNSVFSPLGVKLGAARLVATAERFGFNHAPGIPGAAESTLPPASQIQGELDVGSTAIGQGQVLASPLEMATVAATIAEGGQRPQPTFLPLAAGDASARAGAPVTSSAVAHTMRRLMIAVVREGTGTAGAIPGVTVAGKTGTAELKTLCSSAAAGEGGSSNAHASSPAGEATHEGCGSSESEAANTDAWFAAFAPALKPRIVVCVMLVKDGAGGATAAPVAREVMEAALQAER
ncbi:MAG TPA: penicillin-binding transpeptidase domain-containing protein [Solirubrobacteraceae bacterium]|nr:penicillin-binding transpeptidase domain-containing protein [Solirubrobacteraceae bacterium]